MKNWTIWGVAAGALALGAGLSMAVAQATASGPQRPLVQAVVPLDASGNGSGRGVWIVGEDGSVKYCVTGLGKAAPGMLPTPVCSPWNIAVRYAAPKVN
jgi:hypothetical protein